MPFSRGDHTLASILGYDPKYEGLDPKYPSPPRVHWLALLVAWIAIGWLIGMYGPPRYRDLLQSLVVDAWVFYLCNWVRILDPESKSPFWCDVYVVVELACASLGIVHSPSNALSLTLELLGFASAILGIATVFLVRSDLQRHYNEREHAGLVLNGVTTFFFSFLYFQYHLYDIAKRKQALSENLSGSPYNARLP
jgi:hypothetical protein